MSRYLFLPSLDIVLIFVLTQAPCAQPDLEQAITAIKTLGGTLERDPTIPGAPVTAVRLRATQTSDAELVLLKGLPAPRALDLAHTGMTDTGLGERKGLS